MITSSAGGASVGSGFLRQVFQQVALLSLALRRRAALPVPGQLVGTLKNHSKDDQQAKKMERTFFMSISPFGR